MPSSVGGRLCRPWHRHSVHLAIVEVFEKYSICLQNRLPSAWAIAPQVLSSSETSTIPNETTAMYQTTSHPCGFSVAMLSQVLVHNSEKIL